MIRALWLAVRDLHPAYFAMVMATGMLAVAARYLRIPAAPQALTWLNLGLYVVLSLMTLARAALFPALFWADLLDHSRGVGFFTLVAGTCVLATGLIVIFGSYAAAAALWFAGLALWVGLTYGIFAGFTVKMAKPPLEDGINGGWLIAVVATQALSNLGALLLPRFDAHKETILFLSLTLWLCGGMLYIWMISIIFYRYTFFRFSPSDLMPPYWINMGAMAISTLTGTTLMANTAQWIFLEQIRPFLAGFTVMFWATASWWIPMLVILGIWRHVYKRFRIGYDPLYWGAVFPLAMYSACTWQLARVTEIPQLMAVARVSAWVALASWTATFAGFVHALLRGKREAA